MHAVAGSAQCHACANRQFSVKPVDGTAASMAYHRQNNESKNPERNPRDYRDQPQHESQHHEYHRQQEQQHPLPQRMRADRGRNQFVRHLFDFRLFLYCQSGSSILRDDLEGESLAKRCTPDCFQPQFRRPIRQRHRLKNTATPRGHVVIQRDAPCLIPGLDDQANGAIALGQPFRLAEIRDAHIGRPAPFPVNP